MISRKRGTFIAYCLIGLALIVFSFLIKNLGF